MSIDMTRRILATKKYLLRFGGLSIRPEEFSRFMGSLARRLSPHDIVILDVDEGTVTAPWGAELVNGVNLLVTFKSIGQSAADASVGDVNAAVQRASCDLDSIPPLCRALMSARPVTLESVDVFERDASVDVSRPDRQQEFPGPNIGQIQDTLSLALIGGVVWFLFLRE